MFGNTMSSQIHKMELSIDGPCMFSCRMLLHGLNILNQKLQSSKKPQKMELRSQMHPLQAKATLGIDMVFPNYLVLCCVTLFLDTKTFDSFCSVSDLLDYISPDQDPKGGDAQRKQRRAKVVTYLTLFSVCTYKSLFEHPIFL